MVGIIKVFVEKLLSNLVCLFFFTWSYVKKKKKKTQNYSFAIHEKFRFSIRSDGESAIEKLWE